MAEVDDTGTPVRHDETDGKNSEDGAWPDPEKQREEKVRQDRNVMRATTLREMADEISVLPAGL